MKNLLQERNIPPWQRDRLPLLFFDEVLVCVPGIGEECSYQAVDCEEGVVLEWEVVTIKHSD